MAAEIRRGTLERVPRTPQNFLERIIIAVTQRSRPVPRASPYRTLPPRPPPVPLPAQPRGCKGRSPLHKKTMILPLPAGKGAGGIGAERTVKVGQTGNHPVKPPPGVPPPPAASAPPGASPYRTLPPRPPPAPLPAQLRGCKGRSPLHEKTMILPLPRRGRGLGGWGQEGW